MELRRYLSVIRARWGVILVLALAGLLGGFTITPRASQYTATSTLVIGSRVLQPDQGDVSTERNSAVGQLAYTYALLIESEPMAAKAAQAAGVARSAKEILRATKAEPVYASSLLLIQVKDRDPVMAQRLSRALAYTFVEDVQNYEPGRDEGAVPTFRAYVFDAAGLPTVPDPTSLLRNLLIGLVVGAALGLALVLLFDYLDITLRSAGDAERRLELPVLGVIPSLGDELPATPALQAIRARQGVKS